jgi:hypothetical protein
VLVVRSGRDTSILPEAVVRRDALRVSPGTQLVVDGPVLAGAVDVDESLLTGESDAPKRSKSGLRPSSASFRRPGTGSCSVCFCRFVEVFGEGDSVSVRSLSIIFGVAPVQGGLAPLRQVRPVRASLGGELLPIALAGALLGPLVADVSIDVTLVSLS